MNDTSELYTDLAVAGNEVRRRWDDPLLRKEVLAYLGAIPEVFQQEPRAVLFRHIITPDHELSLFLDKAHVTGLKPLGLEFVEDKFFPWNGDKMALAKLPLFEKRDRNGKAIVRHRKVIDIQKWTNARFTDIQTLNGEGLVAFHHRLLRKNLCETPELQDCSSILHDYGDQARRYYERMLAWFVVHGVLFESFLTDDNEAEFKQTVVLPAFAHVHHLFGLKPLIVELLPDTEDRYWWCYPADIFE